MRFLLLFLAIPWSASAQKLALGGLDPVELTRGRTEMGMVEYSEEHHGLRYRFVSAASRDNFMAAPERYAVQMDGACARMGPASGAGAPERFRVVDGRIYLFASEECSKAFDAAPRDYIDVVEPRPSVKQADQDRAASLLDKALKAMGAVAQAKGIAIVSSLPEGAAGSVYVKSVTWSAVFPDKLSIERDYEGWGQDADSVDASAGEYRSPEGTVPHRPAQYGAVRESLRRHPVWLARSWKEAGAVAWWGGLTRLGDTPADRVMVWIDGAVSEVWVDAEGRIMALGFRGRGPGGRIGRVEHRYSEFKQAGGYVLPHKRETLFDGQPLAGQTQTVTSIRALP